MGVIGLKQFLDYILAFGIHSLNIARMMNLLTNDTGILFLKSFHSIVFFAKLDKRYRIFDFALVSIMFNKENTFVYTISPQYF